MFRQVKHIRRVQLNFLWVYFVQRGERNFEKVVGITFRKLITNALPDEGIGGKTRSRNKAMVTVNVDERKRKQKGCYSDLARGNSRTRTDGIKARLIWIWHGQAPRKKQTRRGIAGSPPVLPIPMLRTSNANGRINSSASAWNKKRIAALHCDTSIPISH